MIPVYVESLTNKAAEQITKTYKNVLLISTFTSPVKNARKATVVRIIPIEYLGIGP